MWGGPPGPLPAPWPASSVLFGIAGPEGPAQAWGPAPRPASQAHVSLSSSAVAPLKMLGSGSEIGGVDDQIAALHAGGHRNRVATALGADCWNRDGRRTVLTHHVRTPLVIALAA